jgi:hypothetical protein
MQEIQEEIINMTQSHILTLTLKEQARWFKYTAISVFKQESIEKIIKTWSQEQRSDFTKRNCTQEIFVFIW